MPRFDAVRDAEAQNTPPIPTSNPQSNSRRATDLNTLLNTHHPSSSSTSNHAAPPRAESPEERLGAASAIRRAELPPLNTSRNRSTPLESPGSALVTSLFTPGPHTREMGSYFPPVNGPASPVHQRPMPPPPTAGVYNLPSAHAVPGLPPPQRVLPPAHNLDTSSRSRPGSSHSAGGYPALASPAGHPAYQNQSPVFAHRAPLTQRVSFERGGSSTSSGVGAGERDRPRSSSHGSATSDAATVRPASGSGGSRVYEGRQRSESERVVYRYPQLGSPESPAGQGYVRQRAGSPTPAQGRAFIHTSPQEVASRQQPQAPRRPSDPSPHPARRQSGGFASGNPPPGAYANREPPSLSSIPPQRRVVEAQQQQQQARTPVNTLPGAMPVHPAPTHTPVHEHPPHAQVQHGPPQAMSQQQYQQAQAQAHAQIARRNSAAILPPHDPRAREQYLARPPSAEELRELRARDAAMEQRQAQVLAEARVPPMSPNEIRARDAAREQHLRAMERERRGSVSLARPLSPEEIRAVNAQREQLVAKYEAEGRAGYVMSDERTRRPSDPQLEDRREGDEDGRRRDEGAYRAHMSAMREQGVVGGSGERRVGGDIQVGRREDLLQDAVRAQLSREREASGSRRERDEGRSRENSRSQPQWIGAPTPVGGPSTPHGAPAPPHVQKPSSSSGPVLPSSSGPSLPVMPSSSGPVMPTAAGPMIPFPGGPTMPTRRSPPATDKQPARKRARRDEPEREPASPMTVDVPSPPRMSLPTPPSISSIPPPNLPPPVTPVPPPVTPANADSPSLHRPPSPVKNVKSAMSIKREEADATPTPHPHHPHPTPHGHGHGPQIAGSAADDVSLPTQRDAPHVTTTTPSTSTPTSGVPPPPTTATPTPTSATASTSTPTPTMSVPPPMSAIPMPVMPAQSSSKRNGPPLTAANLPVPIVAAGKKPPPVTLSPSIPTKPFNTPTEEKGGGSGVFVGGMVEEGAEEVEERVLVARGITRKRKATGPPTGGMVHPLPPTPQPLPPAPPLQRQPSQPSHQPPPPQPTPHSQPTASTQPHPTTRPYAPLHRVTPPKSVMVPLTSDELAIYKTQLGRGTARLAKRRRALDEFEVDLGVDLDTAGAGAGGGGMESGGGGVNGGGGGNGAGGKGKRSKDVVSVVEHYNARPNQAVSARQLSPIIGLRNFNNWIKSVLISAFALPALQNSATSKLVRNPLRGRVLDVGCGKGGDLSKWHRARIAEYVGLDIAAISVNQAKERHNTLRPPKFDAFFGALDCFTHALERAVPAHDLRTPFDVVSLQFCMHYAFESESKVRRMLENISSRLRVGGRVVGTVPNDELLLGRLADGEKSWGNSVCRITFEEGENQEGELGKGTGAGRDREGWPLYGHRYRFFLQDAVEDVPEYVVQWGPFVRLAAEYGLHPIYKREFHDVFDEFREHHEFEPLLQRMKVVDQNGETDMDEDQWEAANIYVMFALEKREGGSRSG